MSRTARLLICLPLMWGCPSKTRRTWEPTDHQQPYNQEQSQQAQAVNPHGDTASSENTTNSAVRVLWITQCSRCHGENGAGDGPGRLPMMSVPNMQDTAWQQSNTDESLTASIVNGKGMMPAFGKALRPEAIQGLIAYVRGFAVEKQ